MASRTSAWMVVVVMALAASGCYADAHITTNELVRVARESDAGGHAVARTSSGAQVDLDGDTALTLLTGKGTFVLHGPLRMGMHDDRLVLRDARTAGIDIGIRDLGGATTRQLDVTRTVATILGITLGVAVVSTLVVLLGIAAAWLGHSFSPPSLHLGAYA